jgi:hypothetical protein
MESGEGTAKSHEDLLITKNGASDAARSHTGIKIVWR